MLQRYNFYLSFAKKWAKNLQDSKNTLTFAADFKTLGHWRDGRVVDYSGLENRRAERHRGFESLSLRKEQSAWIALFCLLAIDAATI